MSKTKERIHDSNLRYKQGLGQNFIYDEDLLAALVASSEITKDDDVLEIGPGAGSMTKYLCEAAHHVLSSELDDRLIPLLTAFLAERDNFTLVQGDVMTLNLADVTKDLRKPLSVVANIPYYITTPLLTMLLASPIPIRRMALMVQKEVADRMQVGREHERLDTLAKDHDAAALIDDLRHAQGKLAQRAVHGLRHGLFRWDYFFFVHFDSHSSIRLNVSTPVSKTRSSKLK